MSTMTTTITAAIVFACLVAAVLVGIWIRRLLPDHHLSGDSKDAVKLAMGMVVTMTALLLGLLVSAAKETYDTQRSEIIQLAAKVTFLDRVLVAYGPEAAEAHTRFREAVEQSVHRIWPNEAGAPGKLDFNAQAGNTIYTAIHALSPRDDRQRELKAQALNVAVDLGQLRVLLSAQMVPSIPRPLLIVVVCWLMVIFLSFSMLAPTNPTTTVALLIAIASVVGAVFLILELDHPLAGIIRIPSEPMLRALEQFAK